MSLKDKKRLLIIDDEENMRHVLTKLLEKSHYAVETAADGLEALSMIENQTYNFILCDLKMPRMDGMKFLETAGEKLANTTVIVMSAYGTIETAIEAMKRGAYDYISKPFKSDEVCMALRKAEERESLKVENNLLKQHIQKIEESYCFGKMVAKSPAMQTVFALTARAGKYDTTVLITGESGTGKELVARAIHSHGDRSHKPMITVNCGGIPENLLESEFFGFKKGSFTGADRNQKGLFEEADGGIMFLDEVGELPLNLQVKLLRVLQEKEIRQIGDAKTKKVDVRVLAATAKNLEDEIKEGNFRQDLYYRLNVLPIHIPPLRQRLEDIPVLCDHFITKLKKSLDRKDVEIVPEAMSALIRYHWPGNVRELENVIERAMVMSDDEFLRPEHFPSPIINADIKEQHGTNDLCEGYSLKSAQKVLERKMIIKALNATEGNRTQASRLLEISHPSLLSKIKMYNLD